MNRRRLFVALAQISAVLTVLAAHGAWGPAAWAQGPGVIWALQFGSPEGEQARGISVDATGVSVAGSTEGLPGQPGAGLSDGFVRRYTTDGGELWTRLLGSPAGDRALAVGGHDGRVYVTGTTFGTLPGQPINEGFSDVFAHAADDAGNPVWTRQLGGHGFDQAFGLAVDGTGVYEVGFLDGFVAGSDFASNAFLRRYSLDGDVIWTRDFGTPDLEQALSVSMDASGVYVAGDTRGDLAQPNAGELDPFVRKYTRRGATLWTRQFGTPREEQARTISVGPSGVYVAGWTFGALTGAPNAGGRDAYVRKYDPDGALLWTRQFGTVEDDQINGASADASGVYVVGYSEGTLPGQISQGGRDAFVRRLDADGNVVWTSQLGTDGSELFFNVAADATGIYAAGRTDGSLPGHTNAGRFDVLVARLALPTPVGGVQELRARVDALDLRSRVSRRLDRTLRITERILADGRRRNDVVALVTLRIFVFLVEAQRSRQISDSDADSLVALARELIALIRTSSG